MNNKGQAVMAEYVMVFFVVIAALVAMTVFVQRTFEARIHDVRNFMVNAVMSNSVCDANCLAATGNQISYQYEPYYLQELVDAQSNSTDYKGATTGNPQALGAKYINAVNEATQIISTGCQLPPECADPATANSGECVCPPA